MANVKEKVKDAAKKTKDALTAVEIEAKKTTRAASRKAKEAVDKAADETKAKTKRTRKAKEAVEAVENVIEKAKAPARRAKAAKLSIMIQSPMGGNITPEEIAQKVPEGTAEVFVRIDQNKLWWVKKDGETGSVDIW